MSNYNSNSDIVMHVQTAINAAGYTPPLTADGKFGPKTRTGVVWFQRQRGLTADGIIGDATVAAVAAVGAAPTSTATDTTIRDPVGELQSEVDRLKAQQAPPVTAMSTAAPPAPALVPIAEPRKVIAFHLGGGGGAPAGATLATTPDTAVGPTSLTAAAGGAPTAPAGHHAGLAIPVWAGTAAGVLGGAAIGYFALGALAVKAALGAAIGGAAGAALDYVRHMTAHPATGASTMHGEFDRDLGFDDDYGDLTAGGNPVNYSALRG